MKKSTKPHMMKVCNTSEIVEDNDLPEFERRCQGAFKKCNLQPTDEHHALFGTCALDEETKNNHSSKTRAFIEFLLKTGKHDDSPLPFHPKCPRGVIAVSAAAASDFMVHTMSEKGTPLSTVDGKEIQTAEGEALLGTG